MPGIRGMRIGFAATAGLVGALAVLAWGALHDQWLLGALGAAAVISLAWTLATVRRPR